MLCVFDVDSSNQDEAARLLIDLFELLCPRAQKEAKALPPLYQSGIKYVSQDPRACAFRYPKDVYERKGGDCKQVVLWRMGECRNAGIHVKPRIIWLADKAKEGKFVAHAQLRHPTGKEHDKQKPEGDVEDPSYNLGMKAP
jgi:hypothetical protein